MDQGQLVDLAKRAHGAWTAGEISAERKVEVADFIAAQLGVKDVFSTLPGRELIKQGSSPLSPQQNRELARREFALAKLKRNPDGVEQVAKRVVSHVETDAYAQLKRLAADLKQDGDTDAQAFSKAADKRPDLVTADRTQKWDTVNGKDRESFAMASDGYGHHSDPDVELNDLADAHMAEHNKANPRSKKTFEQSHAFVAENDPVGRKLFRQSKMRSLSKNATA